MIEAATVTRDEMGQWTHPALDELIGDREGVPPEEWAAWKEHHGIETKWRDLEGEEDDCPAAHSLFELGDPDISDWPLTSPSGAGWILLSVHFTEESAVQVWARPKTA